MKRPQPDLGAMMQSSFITAMGGVRKMKRLWGTETLGGVEVLPQRQYYHPASARQGYDGTTPTPKEFEKLMRFMGVYDDVTTGSMNGVDSAWLYFNKNKLNASLVNPNQFVTDNLNLVFWDPADGAQPAGLTLTTSIVIERKLGLEPAPVKVGSDYSYAVPVTELLDPSMTEAQMIQIIQANYETLWNTCLIKQDGVGVINKGSYKDPVTGHIGPDEDDLSPDDPWLSTIARYALRSNGIPCTIKKVEIGMREAFRQPHARLRQIAQDPARILYNSYVVTLEIPATTFSSSELFVQSIANDITASYPKRRARQSYLNDTNGYFTKQALRAMDSTDLDNDESLINRPYALWEDSTVSGDTRFDAIWYNYNGGWYLRADAFTNPRAYNLTFKELGHYIFNIVDSGYKKKKVPTWKKVVAVVVVIVIVVLSVVFPPAGAGVSAWAVAAASAVLAASLALIILAALASALGHESWAMAFAEVNKDIEPLVMLATIILIVFGVYGAIEAAKQAGAATTSEAVKQVVLDQLEGLVENVLKGATDVMAGEFFTNAALSFLNTMVKLSTMPMQNKIESINDKNKDLKAEYEQLVQEASREYDVLQGFMNVYAKPATADWSIYASTFDLPYERGGGPMALGNVQRTTVQALRKGTYRDPAFENILVV